MASVFSAEDLRCSLCLRVFTDPVSLGCGHSFCRSCIRGAEDALTGCPQCPTGSAWPPSDWSSSLKTNQLLKNLAEKARAAEEIQTESRSDRERVAAEFICPEHDEKLKLFCVTDQKMTCIICRDGEKHEGHKFKPVKEAAASLRQQIEKGVGNIAADIQTIESRANSQREEITKTKDRSHQLMTQICGQFKEMHDFLRKRKDEIKRDLKDKEKDIVEKMSRSLNTMETTLSECRELEGKVTSVLNMTNTESFLKTWTDGNSLTPDQLFRPRADDLTVVKTSLSLGPYESHLQFFMWKEMLQVIQPREEKLSLKSSSENITLSNEGRSVLCTAETFGSNHIKQKKGSSSLFGTPKVAAPLFGSSNVRSSHFGTPSSGTPNVRSSPFGTPSSGTPNVRSSPFGTPSSGTPNVRSSPFGTPSSGTPNVRSSPFGTPSSGTPNVGSSHFGTSAFGTSHVNSSPGAFPFEEVIPPLYPLSTELVSSVNKFSTGQHYWEIEVGQRSYWELGVNNNFLKYDGGKYTACGQDKITFEGRPRKIGLYLNCSAWQLSFYDAKDMSHIHTTSCGLVSVPLTACLKVNADKNHVMVCWY